MYELDAHPDFDEMPDLPPMPPVKRPKRGEKITGRTLVRAHVAMQRHWKALGIDGAACELSARNGKGECEMSSKEMNSKKGKRYGHILTKEVLQDWYDKYYVGENRSLSWLGKRENNGVAVIPHGTLAYHFRKHGFELRSHRQATGRGKAVVPASTPAPSTNGRLPAAAIAPQHLPSSIADQVRKAWEQVEGLQDVGELEVTAVTLSFDLRIGRNGKA